MGLNYKTNNLHVDIRTKKPIAGLDFDSSQIAILFTLGLILFYFIFIANISFLWKALVFLIILLLAINLIKKYDDTKLNIVHNEYGRNMFLWFRIYLRKISKGNISIDRGNDYKYFKK